MCLFAFSDNVEANKLRQIYVFQREEFFERSTLQLDYNFKEFGKEYENIIAGADLLNPPGSWFAINTKTGDIAILTNFRTACCFDNTDNFNIDNAKSKSALLTPKKFKGRGHLVIDFCKENIGDKADIINKENHNLFWKQLRENSATNIYKKFNFIGGSLLVNKVFQYYTNNGNKNLKNIDAVDLISPHLNDFHVLSNSYVNDNSWPRVAIIKNQLRILMNEPYCFSKNETSNDIHYFKKIFSLMSNENEIHDHLLPKTGVEYQWEKELGKIFVNYKEKKYGSKSCTIVFVKSDDTVVIAERSLLNNNNSEFKNFNYRVYTFKIGDVVMTRQTFVEISLSKLESHL